MDIHLWVWGIFFMMTSAAAVMMPSTDDMDRPEPRGDDANQLQHTARANIIQGRQMSSSEGHQKIDLRWLKADIMFLLDTSSYMTEDNFTKAKDFMRDFVEKFDIGPSRVYVGVITYDSDAHTEFWLNAHDTSSSLFAAIHGIGFKQGQEQPKLASALRLVRMNAFIKAHGDREDAPNILIMIGDGRAVDEEQIIREKAELNKTDIRIYCAGFYQNITSVMMTIASKHENNFRVKACHNLNPLRVKLTKAVSEEIVAIAPPRKGTFSVSIYVADVHQSGTSDWYYIIVEFESRKIWGQSYRITPGAGFYRNSNYTYDTDAVYYGIYDQIRQVLVYKNIGIDGFFPEYFIINGPRVCDRYVCNWKKECIKEDAASDKMYDDCFLSKEDAVAVPCVLENADARCARLYD